MVAAIANADISTAEVYPSSRAYPSSLLAEQFAQWAEPAAMTFVGRRSHCRGMCGSKTAAPV